MSDKNIFQRINAVREAVPYIKKDKRVQGYLAVTHDSVTALLHDACVENGIVIIPSEGKRKIYEVGKTSSGTVIIRYESKYKITFVNADEPKDRFVMKIRAHANDHGDKAPGKCLSYAVKSAMLKVFMLETGENDESRVEPARREREKITEKQVQWIEDKVEEYGIDENAFKSFLKKNRVDSYADISVPFFIDVERMIENKKPKGDKKDA